MLLFPQSSYFKPHSAHTLDHQSHLVNERKRGRGRPHASQERTWEAFCDPGIPPRFAAVRLNYLSLSTQTHTKKDLRGKRNFFSSQTCFPKMQLVATIRSSFWINTFPTGNTVELSTYLRTRPVLISVPTKRSYCCYHLFSILHCANQRNTSESRKILPILEELLHTLNPD